MSRRAWTETILANLIYLEEHRTELLDMYYPAASRKRGRQDMERWMDRCITVTEQTIARAGDSGCEDLVLVLIGTTVTVRTLDQQHALEQSFTICFPHQVDPGSGYISIFSPQARLLLMKALEDRTTLFTPEGEAEARIASITVPSVS